MEIFPVECNFVDSLIFQREAKLKAQLDEATKTCEELSRLRVVIANMQKRVDNAFKDLELKDEVIEQLKHEKEDLRRDCDAYAREVGFFFYLSHPEDHTIFPGSMKCRSGSRVGDSKSILKNS